MSIRARDIRIIRKDKLYKTRGTRNLVSQGIEIDPNILDYQTRVAGEGGTLNDHSQLEALSIMYQSWVSDSIRSLLLRINLWPTDGFAGFNVPVVYNDTVYTDPAIGNTVDANNNFVSGDFVYATGLKGNGTTKFLDTGFNPSTVAEVSQNNIGFFVITSEIPPPSGTGYDIGASLSSIVAENGGDLFIAVSSASKSPVVTPALGFLWAGRQNGSDIEITLNGTDYTTSEASIGESPFSLYVYALNVGVDFAHSNRRLVGYGITKYMTPTERSNLYNSITTFNAAIGR